MDVSDGEYLIGEAANGVWDKNVYVRLSQVFILSNSSASPRYFKASLDASGQRVCSNTRFTKLTFRPTISNCRVQEFICIRDSNADADELDGNPIPAASVLSVSFKAKGASVRVDGSPISGVATGPTVHALTAELDDCSKAVESSGAVDLTVKMPNGETYTEDIGLVSK